MSETHIDDRDDLFSPRDMLKVCAITSVSALFLAAGLIFLSIKAWNHIPTRKTIKAADCAARYLKEDGVTGIVINAERHSVIVTGELWQGAAKLVVIINDNGVTVRPDRPRSADAAAQTGIATIQVKEECRL